MNDVETLDALLEFVIEKKSLDSEISLLDLVLEFCYINELDEEFIGSMIANDSKFKELLRIDCLTTGVLKGAKPKTEEW
jgi:hypothetical protein